MRHVLILTLLVCVAGNALAAEAPTTSLFSGQPLDSRALDSEALQRLGVHLPITEAGRVPGLVATVTPGGNAARMYARGLGTPDPLGNQPVATIVDSVPLPTGIANNFILFDPERLSYHSGPFGTSAGPQALAGAVAVRNHAPGQRVGGFVEAGFGSQARWLLRGSVDLPFDERAAFKLSAYWQGDHGFAHNLTTGERVNDGDMSGVRLAVRLRPADDLTWDMAGAYTENNGENLLNFACAAGGAIGCNRFLTTGMTVAPRLGGAPQYDVAVSGRKADFPLGSEVKTMLLTSRLEWAAANWRVAAITGYVDTDVRQALDFADGRAGPGPHTLPAGYRNGGFTLLHDGGYRQFSQELRATTSFGPLDVTAGGWFANRTSRRDAATIETIDNGSSEGLPLLLGDAVRARTDRELAGFVEATVRQGPFMATAGVRYSDLRFSGPGQTRSDRLWTPNAELSWSPTSAGRLFVRATRGFAAGTHADDPTLVTSGWTYEAGGSTSLAKDRLTLAITGFVLSADHVATTDWLGPPRPSASMKNHGVELELRARPVSGLSLWANAGWQNASYSNHSGLVPLYAPDVTAAAGGSYDLPIPYAGVVLSPTIELRYRSEMATDRSTSVGSAVLANAAVAVRTDDDNWTLALECRNCLNSTDPDSSLYGWTYLPTPRTWMLRARRNF